MTIHKYKYFLLAAALVMVISIVIVFSARSSPVLTVNGVSISEREVSNYTALIQTSYTNFEQKLAISERQNLDKKQVELAAWNQIVESMLIHQELDKTMEKSVREYLMGERLARAEAESTRVAVEELYGASFDLVRDVVFVSQVERDMLSSKLFLEGKNIDDWLLEAKKKAKISIHKGGFSWNGEIVVVK